MLEFEVCLAFSVQVQSKTVSPPRLKLFKARYPLEGGPPQLRLHVAIIVEDISGCMAIPDEDSVLEVHNENGRRLVLFDFLPQDPTALYTAARLLTGGDVPATLRERSLRFLPSGAVCIGESDSTLEEMRGFVRNYPDRLSLFANSCISFVDAFVARHRVEEGRP